MRLKTTGGYRPLSSQELDAYIAGLSAGVQMSPVMPDYRGNQALISAWRIGFEHGSA